MAKNIFGESGIGYDTPIAMMTIGQLVDVLKKAMPSPEPPERKEYVSGLRGIMDLFKVSHKTAQSWKNGFLAPACEQYGKTILIDREKAIELFKESGRKAK